MWLVWVDDRKDAHVVEAIDVTPMQTTQLPAPWHVLGDVCPCQPRILDQDPITGVRTVGHQDPIN